MVNRSNFAVILAVATLVLSKVLLWLPAAGATGSAQQDLLQRSRQVIDQVPDPGDRLPLLLQLADTLIAMGLGAPAQSRDINRNTDGDMAGDPAGNINAELVAILAEAARLVPQQPPVTQADHWLAIAERYITLGLAPEALTALTQAEAAASSLEPLAQAQRLQAIAAHRADLLQPSQAMAALEQAKALVPQIPTPQAGLLLTSLALQYADLGQTEVSNALLAQAEALVTVARAPDEPPESVPPEAMPPEAMPPESVPPESVPPESIPDSTPPPPTTPLTPQPWDGTVGLLGSFFSGESSRGVVSLAAAADRQWERTAAEFGLQLTYNIDDDEDDPDQFSVRFDAEAEHYLADSWQYFIDGSVASDDLENLQLRASLFNGLGIRLLRRGDRELGLRTGLGIRYENFEEEGPDINPPALSVGLTYRDRLFSLVQLRQSLNFDTPLGDLEDYLFRSDTSLRIPISTRWSFDQGLRLTLSGERAPDNPGLLLDLQTGLRYQF